MRTAFTARAAGVVASVTLAFLALQVRAASLLDSTGLNETATASGIDKGKGTEISAIVGNVINALLGFSGIVLVVLFIYAGFLWMTAQGDDGKVKTAKMIIQRAIIGTVIMFSAYVIANTVASFVANGVGIE